MTYPREAGYTSPPEPPEWRDERVYPLTYTTEVQCGIICGRDGYPEFTDAKRAWGDCGNLFVKLVQDAPGEAIEIAEVRLGADEPHLAMTGMMGAAAHAYLELLPDLSDRFNDNAVTDWKRIRPSAHLVAFFARGLEVAS